VVSGLCRDENASYVLPLDKSSWLHLCTGNGENWCKIGAIFPERNSAPSRTHRLDRVWS